FRGAAEANIAASGLRSGPNPLNRSTLETGQHFPSCREQRPYFTPGHNSLAGIEAMPERTVALALWCTAARPMAATDIPAAHGRRLAAHTGRFRPGGATGCNPGSCQTVYGVGSEFLHAPLLPPPWCTSPTTAWPPSCTVTLWCCTR